MSDQLGPESTAQDVIDAAKPHRVYISLYPNGQAWWTGDAPEGFAEAFTANLEEISARVAGNPDRVVEAIETAGGHPAETSAAIDFVSPTPDDTPDR